MGGEVSRPMTDVEYERLWRLIETKSFSPDVADAIDFILADDTYSRAHNGWSGLADWISSTIPDQSSSSTI